LTSDRALVLELQAEFQNFCETGGLGSAELFQLGRSAAKIANRRGNSHRVVAFVLRSVFFDLASRVEGDPPINPGQAGSALAALDAPARAAISSLNGPLDANRAVAIAGRLLDAKQAFLEHIGQAKP
jgi:hypothetical protein